MYVKYKAMPPNYYDSKLSSVFESCIRNKFVGLNTVNEIRSDYIKHFARQAEEAKLVPVQASQKKKQRLLSDLLK